MTKYLPCAMLIVAFALPAAPDASAAKLPISCGGFIGATCAPGQFCQAPAGQCFTTILAGTCTPVPRQCINLVRQVCGCDGRTYNSDCLRRQARVSKAHDGRCF